jgi:hypothetical protein
MSLRWLWLDLVPPELNLSTAQRVELARRIKESTLTPGERRRHRWIIMPAALGLAVALGAGAIAAALMQRHFASGPALLFAVTWFGLWWIGFARLVAFSNRGRTCSALRGLGYDVCVRCGYWLRGLGDDVKHCPECGAEREPMAP